MCGCLKPFRFADNEEFALGNSENREESYCFSERHTVLITRQLVVCVLVLCGRVCSPSSI